MRFQTPLIPATLIRRYKRFLADVRLEDGTEVTAHCPNPGAMLGLKDEGLRVWLEPNDNPKKKLKYGWRLAELADGHMAGIDTSIPNRVVKEALIAGRVSELNEYKTIQPEIKYGQNSRVDFLLTQSGLQDTYVEVKNVHLRRESDWAEFPDSVTLRGTKHLHDLVDVIEQGHRAVMFYLVQRTDCTRLRLASDLDPKYAAAFDHARTKGVEVFCYGTQIDIHGVEIANPLFIDPNPQSSG
ncbi:MAG: DNA/RNA nuclease SfsA [Litoreibacter sp.]